MNSYVYLGVAGNETATFVDIDMAGSGGDAAAHARALLAEHRSCDRVEIWRGDERVAVVARPAQAAAS